MSNKAKSKNVKNLSAVIKYPITSFLREFNCMWIIAYDDP
jgi:hypothetical protein